MFKTWTVPDENGVDSTYWESADKAGIPRLLDIPEDLSLYSVPIKKANPLIPEELFTQRNSPVVDEPLCDFDSGVISKAGMYKNVFR
jgi:hypothetical protein